MPVTKAPHARGRPWGEPLAVALACFSALAALALLPGEWRLAGVPLAVVAGAAIERYRQGSRERPLSLAETPQEWKRTLGSVGWAYALPALIATAGAVAVLALPALRSEQPRRSAANEEVGPPSGPVPQLPHVRILRQRPGGAIRVRGASFRVILPRAEPWAQVIRSRRASGSVRWVAVAIEGRNLARTRFNPNALAYRVKDARGNRFAPVIGGGTGPRSLGRTGFLGRGESSQARLGFRVPRSARHLTLLFEPVRDGSVQVEVPLRRDRSR